MAKRRLSPADFDVVRGSANDVKAFRKFVEQEGPAATAIVQDAIDRGNAKVQKAAWLCLAELDLPGAEARALAIAEGLSKKKKGLEPLQFVATTACLDRLVALGVEVYPDKLADQALSRAQGWAMAKLLRSTEVETQERVLEEWFPHYRREPPTLDVLRGALDEPSLLVRDEVFRILISERDVSTCRRDDVPEALVIDARFVLPANEAFERLRPVFEANALQRGPLIRALTRQPESDPRWVELFSSLDDSALRMSSLFATRRPEALALLAPLIRAMEPGAELLAALTELRGFNSPEAAALLVPWLARPELDGNAALLATSLRSCGSPSDAAALEAAAARNPNGAMFYLEAVSHIQARHRG
jgi:hypothetical protein